MLISDVLMMSMLMPAREGAEHARRRARIARHACADDRDLRHILLDEDGDGVELVRHLVDDLLRLIEVVRRHREDHVRDVLLNVADALHDHVDVDAGLASAEKISCAMPGVFGMPSTAIFATLSS